jgi:hypothetical protein
MVVGWFIYRYTGRGRVNPFCGGVGVGGTDLPTFAFRPKEPFSSHNPPTIRTQGLGFTRLLPNSPESNMIRHNP